MTRLVAVFGLLVLLKGVLFMLAGCGVEGPPRPPEAPPAAGIAVGGEARFGVVRRF